MVWLVLEDNPNRTAAFQSAAKLCPQAREIRIWRIAAQMIRELPEHLSRATLLSLDHDLYRQDAGDPEPGCGRDVANYLATQKPHCPVIIHSTNTDAAWGMRNELTSAGWEVELIHHLDEADWIQVRWFALARKLTRNEAAPVPIDPNLVTLREITSETVLPVVRLTVAESQKGFVAPNSVSLAQALFAPEAWYRAIYFGEELAGFIMLEDQSLRSPPPAKPEVGVWRFMIDARFQGRGIGKVALLKVIEHVRAKGVFASLQLSYVPGPGCPEPFYRDLGFRPTGRLDGIEVVLELPLDETQPSP